MKFETHGIILFTQNFDACVRFYKDIIELPVWFQKEGLVCLRFGEGYLMVETGGASQPKEKLVGQNPTVLRLNVLDVDAAALQLRQKGVRVNIERFDWGVVGVFIDPDGNRCELKNADDKDFC